MLRNSNYTRFALTLMTALLSGLTLSLPVRSQSTTYFDPLQSSGSWYYTHTQLQYLRDWAVAEPGLMLLVGLVFAIAVVWAVLMWLNPGPMVGSVQNYLYLQAGVGLIATAGLVLLTRNAPSSEWLSGFDALIIMGLSSSLGSALWASGRLDQWLLSRN